MFQSRFCRRHACASAMIALVLAGVPARTHYVRVAAVSACGVGAPSNEVALTVP